MGLKTQPPLRVFEAIAHGKLCITLAIGSVHGLQVKVSEIQMGKLLWRRAGLGKNELYFVPGLQYQFRARLGTDANPVDAGRRKPSAVGFDRDFKTPCVNCMNRLFVELKQGFASCADNEALARSIAWPFRGNGVGKFVGR
jgi:hypothetical protein